MTALPTRFPIATASVPGSEHRRLLRNNQDAVAVRRTESSLAVVVSDGCSAGRATEVGAQLSAHLLANALVSIGEPSWAAVDGALVSVLTRLAALTAELAPDVQRADTVHHFLLSTTLAALIAEGSTFVFAFGDGIVGINSELSCIDAPHNAPDYLAYGLLADRTPRPCFARSLATSELEFLLLATDGARPFLGSTATAGCAPNGFGIERIRTEALFYRNPSWLQRQLNTQRPAPTDDATIAAIRRTPLEA